MGWDFSKLPSETHEEVIEAYNNKNIAFLLQVHHEYELSDNSYCCGNNDIPIMDWFGYAINNKLIK